jgi:hypothetical protein
MKTAKIIDKQNLVRDMNTNAVLNTDQLAVRRHEKRVADLQKESSRELDINQMKSDINEIKEMLRQLSNSSIIV